MNPFSHLFCFENRGHTVGEIIIVTFTENLPLNQLVSALAVAVWLGYLILQDPYCMSCCDVFHISVKCVQSFELCRDK